MLPATALPDGYAPSVGLVADPGLEIDPMMATTYNHPTADGEYVTVVAGDPDSFDAIFPVEGGAVETVGTHTIHTFEAPDVQGMVLAGVEGSAGPGSWTLAVVATGGPAAQLVEIAGSFADGVDLSGDPVATADLSPFFGISPNTYAEYGPTVGDGGSVTVQYVAGTKVPDVVSYLGSVATETSIGGCDAIYVEFGEQATVLWSDTEGVVIVSGPRSLDVEGLAASAEKAEL